MKLKENFSVTTSISHNFVSPLFFCCHRFSRFDLFFLTRSKGAEDILLFGLLRIMPTPPLPGLLLSDLWLQVPPTLCRCRPTLVQSCSRRREQSSSDVTITHQSLIQTTSNDMDWSNRLMSCPEGPEIYSAGLAYPPTFQHPLLHHHGHHHHHGGQAGLISQHHRAQRHHPPPLAQRERSTSAPNVCYNMVGVGTGVGQQSAIDAALEDWSNRIKVYNLAGTGTYKNLSYLTEMVCCVLSLVNLTDERSHVCCRLISVTYFGFSSIVFLAVSFLYMRCF